MSMRTGMALFSLLCALGSCHDDDVDAAFASACPPIASGALDPAFGTAGVVVTAEEGFDGVRATSIQGDSIFLLIENGLQTWVEKRSLSDGAAVTSFGVSGVLTGGVTFDAIRDISADSDFLYLVGHRYIGIGNIGWRLEKRSATDGSLIGTFGSAGVIVQDPTANSDAAVAVALDETFMYVVGYDDREGDPKWRIEKRFLSDGTLDAGFGAGGALVLNPPVAEIPMTAAIDSNWMYVLGGDLGGWGTNWRLEKRSLSDGALDGAFGSGGFLTGGAGPGMMALDVDSTSIVLVGWEEVAAPDYQWRIEKRSLLDGALTAAFTTNPGTEDDALMEIRLDGAHMYLGGYEQVAGADYQGRIEKRSTSDGA